MLSNPDMIREMVQNPLVQQLMANPGVITELISSNPQTKDWLKVSAVGRMKL
jgi:ubiquilin